MPERIEINPTDIGNTFWQGGVQGSAPSFGDFVKNQTTGSAHCGELGIIPNTTYYFAHLWLRFQIPFATDEITITTAYIKLQKHATLAHFYPLDEIFTRPFYQDTDDAAVPNSVTDVESTLTQVSNVSQFSTSIAPGAFLIEQGGTGGSSPNGIRLELNAVMSRTGWATGNHVLFQIQAQYSGSVNPSAPEAARIHVQGTPAGFDNSYTIIYPILVIEFEYNTPLPSDYDRYVEHTLDIQQFNTVRNLGRRLFHDLTIEQHIAVTRDHGRSVLHTIEFESLPHKTKTYEKTVIHYCIPGQFQSAKLVQVKNVEHVIEFEQEIIRNGPRDKEVRQVLAIEQDISVQYAHCRTVTSTLAFVQTVETRGHYRTVLHAIGFDQDISSDGSLLGTSHHVGHTLVFIQDIGVNHNTTRAVEHVLDIEQAILGYGPRGPGECERRELTYAPIADSSIGFPPLPTLTPASMITLSIASPSTTLLLPAPLMGDREELEMTRIQRKTRGGVLKTFAADYWKKIRRFRYKFEGLDLDKVEETFLFLSLTLGLGITLTDHEGRSWYGYIVNPQGEAAQFFRQCGSTTEFDFEGVPVE